MESHRIQEQQQKQLRQNPPTTIHHLHRHRLHLVPQPKPDQLNLKHLATLHHRRQQLHRFVFLPNHHHQPVHLHPGLADRALVDAHIIVFIVIPRNVDYNVLDHHIQDTVPQQSTQRVAEHPHHTVADLQPVDQNHHAVTLHRILLDAAEHLPEAPAPRSLDPGFITTPDADDTWDWKNNQSDAHRPDDRRPRSPLGHPSHTSARFPTGLPQGTAMRQIQKNPSQSLHTNQETLTLKK